MDLKLEQYLASAVRYIQLRSDVSPVLYFDNIPENFAVPSIYFPVPRTSSRRVTLQTYLTTIRMEAWFMASSDWLAYAAAAHIRDCILLDGCAIEIMEKDGTPTGKGMRVTEPEISRVDEGIQKLSFELKHYLSKKEIEVVKASNINISRPPGAEATLYQAWISATEEQRKEEEVQKECLKIALESL